MFEGLQQGPEGWEIDDTTVAALQEGWDAKVEGIISSADYYFNAYAHLGVHEELIRDSVRTNAYRRAVLQSRHLFAGKVVLDVGCGLPVLSLIAASAGAA